MGLLADIVATYRSPGAVMRRHLDGVRDEGRVLMYLLLACCLSCLAQWPRLQREVSMDGSVALEIRIGGALFGWMFIAPLAMYAVAFLARVVAGALGGRGTGYSARLALFWSMLAVAPLGLVAGLVGGFIGPGPAAAIAGLAGYAVFCVIWWFSMVEAEAGGAFP
ncbi:MAG: YIP1 family protein [Rhodobacter sp.]|nr:YIP1 family protein [Rhodobacter sp.]MCY4168243.1 YIP1 family protein [Rhodobacter sp.]